MQLEQIIVSSQAALVKQQQVRFKEPTPPKSPEHFPPARDPSLQPPHDIERIEEPSEQVYWITEPNELGLFSVYKDRLPSHNPDEEISAETIADAPTFHTNLSGCSPLSVFGAEVVNMLDNESECEDSDSKSSRSNDNALAIAPFLNKSIFLLMNWFYKGVNISMPTLSCPKKHFS